MDRHRHKQTHEPMDTWTDVDTHRHMTNGHTDAWTNLSGNGQFEVHKFGQQVEVFIAGA